MAVVAAPADRDADRASQLRPTGDRADDRHMPGPLRAAVLIVFVQAFALAATAVLLLVKTVIGHPNDVWRAVLQAVMLLLATSVLALAGRGLARLRPAARSPIVVLEVLALPVSYSLAIQAGRVGYGGPILVSALAVLYLVFTPTSRELLSRPD